MRKALGFVVAGLLLVPGSSAVAGCAKAGPLTVGNCPTGSSGSGSGGSGRSQQSVSSPRTDAERVREFVRLINRERARRGLSALVVDGRLRAVAQRHAKRMARAQDIWHNGWIFSRDGRRALGRPRALGENVGIGKTVSVVHSGFMESRSHRANVLRPVFRQIGIGVVTRGNAIYVSEVFARMRGSSGGGSGGKVVAAARGSSRRPPAARPDPVTEAPAAEPPVAVAGTGPRGVPVAAIVGLLAVLFAIARPFRRTATAGEF